MILLIIYLLVGIFVSILFSAIMIKNEYKKYGEIEMEDIINFSGSGILCGTFLVVTVTVALFAVLAMKVAGFICDSESREEGGGDDIDRG